MDRRIFKGAIHHQLPVTLSKGGDLIAYVKPLPHSSQSGQNRLQPVDELRAEHQGLHIREIQTVLNLIGGIAEIQRHRQTPGFQNAKVDGQPLQTVHQQDAHFGPPLQSPAQQEICKPVGLLVKLPPAHLPAVGLIRAVALDQAILPPGGGPVPFLRGVNLYQCCLIPVQPGIAFQKFCNHHRILSLSPSGGMGRGKYGFYADYFTALNGRSQERDAKTGKYFYAAYPVWMACAA